MFQGSREGNPSEGGEIDHSQGNKGNVGNGNVTTLIFRAVFCFQPAPQSVFARGTWGTSRRVVKRPGYPLDLAAGFDDIRSLRHEPIGGCLGCRQCASTKRRAKSNTTVAPATLAKLACVGGGPQFHRAVRTPLYPREELDAWAAERLGKLKRSTSDAGADQ
jgi:hypothetical protein